MSRVEHLSDDVTLYLGDAEVVTSSVDGVGAIVSDPPYPNNAGLFLDGIDAAKKICETIDCDHWLVFWTEVEFPPVPLPLVAVHVWYRTNTNRPDNYEPIFEFRRDGSKKASRVLPYCVIAPGLTGIVATGHPTEKHPDLMQALVKRTSGIVCDPFMGSGTTGVACARLGRGFIGIEREPKWFDIACRRIADELKRPRLQLEPVAKPVQEAMQL